MALDLSRYTIIVEKQGEEWVTVVNNLDVRMLSTSERKRLENPDYQDSTQGLRSRNGKSRGSKGSRTPEGVTLTKEIVSPKAIGEEELALIRKMYKDGMTIKEIAKKLGRADTTIRYRITPKKTINRARG